MRCPNCGRRLGMVWGYGLQRVVAEVYINKEEKALEYKAVDEDEIIEWEYYCPKCMKEIPEEYIEEQL